MTRPASGIGSLYHMASAVYPLPLNRNLARDVTRAARETGLSRAELMRQALAFGLPQVVRALRKPPARLVAVDPLASRQAKALYQQEEDDREQIERLVSAQRFEVAD